jgi:hypothetical protein
MSQLAPPQPPPLVTLDEGDNVRRLRFRLWQMLLTALTVLATAWVWKCAGDVCVDQFFRWLARIIALMVAKHVLVAIFVMGIGVDRRRASDL